MLMRSQLSRQCLRQSIVYPQARISRAHATRLLTRANPRSSGFVLNSPHTYAHAQQLAAFSTSSARRKGDKDGDRDFFDKSVEPANEDEGQVKPDESKAAEESTAQETKKSKSSKDDELAASTKNENGPKDGKSSSAGSSGSGSTGDGSGDGGGKKGKKGGERGLQKPVVPDVYPQVLALPITKRPLFPGFYKAITVKDPHVANAITEMIKRGQPYVGTFLFKDEAKDDDVIRNVDDVYDVGVFAQITSAFPIHGQDGGITAILYPHRRIRLSSLIPPTTTTDAKKADGTAATTVPEPIPQKQAETEEPKGDVVASFEESAIIPKPDPNQPYEPTSFLKKYPVSLVNVENLSEEPYDPKSPFVRAVTNEIVNVFKEVASINNLFRDQISTFSMSQTGNVTADPAKLADFAAAVSSGETAELQEILASLDVEDRMHKALTLLKKELMNAQLQSKISKDVENKITKRQREYWLMEQMKGIRRELGLETDGKDKLIEKFKERARKLAMPEAVRKVFDEEINKLAHLETAASEFNVTRNYLDWLTQIPWGQRSVENFGIKHARTVLDEDHYGLKDVKDRILEFIAVGKLRGTVEGKILCFVGPPGVGKTSIGKSIARALNREYYRFSVGGLTDVAEIKGHRRTYVGALPGRVIQALKKCQTENPLILIDEVDKIGRGYQGDPSSALLELLDPEQNGSFLDHYMDVPVDLSKVLFVCTANMTDTIPRPLLDRMELITLSGYVADEKMAIAQRYLAPAAKEAAGLKEADVQLTDDAIHELIKSYCRESGVRNLKKQIEKVYRKAALKIVQDIPESQLEEAQPEGASAAAETSSEDTAASETASETSQSSQESDESASSTSSAPEEEGTAKTAEAPRALKVPDTVHVSIGADGLSEYIGPPIFTSDRLYDISPPGVSMGLAWTQLGGAAMYVESILQTPLRPHTRPDLEITGNLKNVMKESSSIAYSFAKSFMVKEFPDNHFFQKAKVHLHVPEGAVRKDGPSAGITMATSLLSLALNEPIVPTIAMTGELTLTGKVLRIGGLREKTVAARRAGCKMVIFPKDNLSDWLELPENIKEGIEGKPVGWYSEVFDLVFPNIDKELANTCKICEWAREKKKNKKDEAEEED
ncbi:Lon protease-like protein, mitochondrial [Scedosporium apiospermum]|uniref:Lon protease homolog, mitochondrial n=1 Tax=Pseudallescheria apiosperma TaxID=563466 RepID=A0A084G176_PSEDA|nr:Lon protease-like protein, mitochondrial [Scedosporium apiospermum]KEZ41088.1 Lon protease-like protein, mitochondrial [Scedosporium apiospermum]